MENVFFTKFESGKFQLVVLRWSTRLAFPCAIFENAEISVSTH